MVQNPPKDELVIRWVHPVGTPHVPIRGAIGGLHGDGSITIELYSERNSVGEIAQTPITDGKIKWDETTSNAETHLIRTIQLSAVLTPKIAVQIGAWLLARAQEAEQMGDKSTETSVEESNDDNS